MIRKGNIEKQVTHTIVSQIIVAHDESKEETERQLFDKKLSLSTLYQMVHIWKKL